MLLIVETHPVPYHAPVYRCLASEFGVPCTVIYGSDFSTQGYFDNEFKVRVSWDSDVLSGYEHRFLSKVAQGGGADYEGVTTRGLWPLADSLKPTAVLALGYYHRLDRSAIQYALNRHLPLIFRGETSDRARSRSPLHGMARDAILRRLYQRCHSVLYLGQESRDHYLRLGTADDSLIFSPYCVDDTSFYTTEEDRTKHRAAMRRELGIAEDAIVIVFSGKLSRRKGVDLLPAAIRLLPAALRERTVLLLLGQGELEAELRVRCAERTAVAVRFAGFQNQTQLSPYYHASDVLALPSRERETWGIVVNEGLMHGLTAVVTTEVGCQPDLVLPGQTGAVVEAGSAEALAAGLTRAIELSGTVEQRQRCRQLVERYSAQIAAQGVAEAWRRLQVK